MKRSMRAMILERPGLPLRLAELPLPRPSRGKLLIEVEACGVAGSPPVATIPNPAIRNVLCMTRSLKIETHLGARNDPRCPVQ